MASARQQPEQEKVTLRCRCGVVDEFYIPKVETTAERHRLIEREVRGRGQYDKSNGEFSCMFSWTPNHVRDV